MTTQPQGPAPADPTDEATTPSPDPESPAETFKTRRPGWDRSRLPSSDATGEADGSDAGADSPESSEQLLAPKSRKSGASQGSSRGSKRQLRKAIAVGFTGAAEVAHEFLARDEYAQAVGLWLTDEDEADGVAEPAAEIVGRRMKDVPMGDDLADGVALALAVGAYLLAQLSRWRYARDLRRNQAVIGDGLQHDATHQPTGEEAETWPETPPADPAA